MTRMPRIAATAATTATTAIPAGRLAAPLTMTLALGLAIGACVPIAKGTAPRRDQTQAEWRADLLVARATFDLMCSKEQLGVQQLGHEYAMGVVGCGRRAVYLWDHGHAAWLMNGTMTSGPVELAQQPSAADITNPVSPADPRGQSSSTGGMTTP